MAPVTVQLLDKAVTTAVTAELHGPYQFTLDGGFYTRPTALLLRAEFVYGSGGTTAKAWVQSSLDDTSWFDIANFALTTANAIRMYHLTGAAATSIVTPTDGTLADNTSVNGLLGPYFRVKLTTTGTYAGSTTFKIFGFPS